MITSIQPAMPHAAPAYAGRPVDATARVIVTVDTVGYRVPSAVFVGRVHSTFAQACNFDCGDTLLTLAGGGAGNGPTLLRLAAAPRDLRRVFDVGEPVRGGAGALHSARAEVRWPHARMWRPAHRTVRLAQARIDDHLGCAAAHLARLRAQRSSVVEHAAAATVTALLAACRQSDGRRAAAHAARLVGWGEGLTPAGDDFLVGLCAGLDAQIDGNLARRACRDAIGSAMVASTPRTTTISAHYLRLAAAGHFQERLLAARDALLSSESPQQCDEALRAACAVGATSGADSVAGLLAGLTVWPAAGACDGAA
ncbi:MAG TPA: DUF2877 domain-containing protein [Burkholderiaceae bacterium]|nr:DUF2877 domain-containing protein [Burkholderiaceae bacterium]